YGVRCDPALPYDPEFAPPGPGTAKGAVGGAATAGGAGTTGGAGTVRGPRSQVPVSRRNFVELCRQLTELDERAYAETWRRLGLSVDWSMSYRTVEDGPQAISQRAFLRSIGRDEACLADGPSLWDVTFGTAVAQAELED